MAGLSKIEKSGNEGALLWHPPFFKDHHVSGQAILPAVEAMEALSGALKKSAGVRATDITDALFDKFLFLDAAKTCTAVHYRLDPLEDGAVRAALQTRTRAPKAAITRTKTHAAMIFGPPKSPAPSLPLDLAAAPEGVCRTVMPERLYAELVPFGPAYRNIVDTLYLAADGAIARVGSPRPYDRRGDLVLGSPYPLDAAFHAACAWSQHARNIVAFPVAVAHRKILRPTRMDDIYIARIVPVAVESDTLVFDIFIFDRQGNLCEVSAGVQMRDISNGRTQPPEWIRKEEGLDRLASLRQKGIHLAVIDQRCMAPFTARALSPAEAARQAPMATKRKQSFTAARLALKRLARNLSSALEQAPPSEIDTVRTGSPKPYCPTAGRSGRIYCSVSHDSRFAVAVAADTPVGIDVEPITARAFKNRRLFMNAAEIALLKQFPKGEQQAAVRVWSAKEAAAKALDLPLARAWDRVRLTALGANESRLQGARLENRLVRHATVDDHLFTLLTL